MKLINFKNNNDYNFFFEFENGVKKNVNIYDLVGSKVSKEDLKSARIDSDWGCLEFCDGMIDIEPKTLYKYTINFNENVA
jgi:hypothetical protein